MPSNNLILDCWTDDLSERWLAMSAQAGALAIAQPMESRRRVDDGKGRKTSPARQEIEDYVLRTVPDLLLPLGISEFSVWTPNHQTVVPDCPWVFAFNTPDGYNNYEQDVDEIDDPLDWRRRWGIQGGIWLEREPGGFLTGRALQYAGFLSVPRWEQNLVAFVNEQGEAELAFGSTPLTQKSVAGSNLCMPERSVFRYDDSAGIHDALSDHFGGFLQDHSCPSAAMELFAGAARVVVEPYAQLGNYSGTPLVAKAQGFHWLEIERTLRPEGNTTVSVVFGYPEAVLDAMSVIEQVQRLSALA